MNIHEFQAKQLFREAGIPVPRGEAANTPAEARAVAERLGGNIWVVKAQIHAGGRGKAGGVKIAKSLDEVETLAKAMLGMKLVTHQTGPAGKEVLRVLIEEGIDIKRELYIGIALDRASGRDVMMASTEGGVEIEEVAHKSPEKIIRAKLSPAYGLDGHAARKLAFGLGLTGKTALETAAVMSKLANVYKATDASLMEINPFVIKGDGAVVALDAKMNFDDNALFRQKKIAEMRDLTEEDPKETEAKKWELSYIALDGNIGCMVNGAGLAMATLDTINHFGGSPANFLDVGGGAGKEQVTAAFKIILADPKVKGILVNIFGGIMRCDIIADGVIAAARSVGVRVPLVVRLEGTNVEQGRKMIAESGLNLVTANSLAEAAQKVVNAVKGN